MQNMNRLIWYCNPFSANFTKWSNTLKQFVGNLPTNYLSVFDRFVGLALKEVRSVRYFQFHKFYRSHTWRLIFWSDWYINHVNKLIEKLKVCFGVFTEEVLNEKLLCGSSKIAIQSVVEMLALKYQD